VKHELTGLIVPPHDPAALAKAMVRINTDRELYAQCADGGLARAGQLFDVRKNLPKLVRTVLGVPSGTC
jgi:glycosyltransferase involved in cell wall biosynthesis